MPPLITPADRIFVAGHAAVAGSAICRALERAGYHHLLTASRSELDLLDGQAVERWFAQHQPTVVVLAAAKVGGIAANSRYPADFLLENLKIQTHVIETAWRAGVRRLLFLGSSCICSRVRWSPRTSGMRSPRSPGSSCARRCAASTALMRSACRRSLLRSSCPPICMARATTTTPPTATCCRR
jgi:nucleoside-diphosphate-sugar epimerase